MAIFGDKVVKKKLKKSYRKGDLPTELDDWSDYVEELHRVGLDQRRSQEFQWCVNLAYYLGYQNMVYVPSEGILKFDDLDTTPRSINRIGSFIEARHAKLIKNRPIPRVAPNTNEQEDKSGAKNSDRALMHLWRYLDMENEYDKLVIQMLISGVSFLQTIWDPLSGEYVLEEKEDSQGNIMVNEERGEIENEKIFIGEVSSRVISPFQVICSDPMVSDIKDQEWIIIRKHLSLIEAERLWPHLKGKIQAQDKYATRTEYERIVNRLGSAFFSTHGKGDHNRTEDSTNTEVLIKEFWMKPNCQFERGVLCIKVADEVAYLGDWPNDYGQRSVFPLVKFQERQTGWHFWPQGTIERLIPIQKMYDMVKDKTAKNVFDMGNKKILLPKGSQVHEDSITDEVGEVIEYNPSVPAPAQMAIAPLPNYVSMFEEKLIVDFRDVGGQREASLAPPSNLTAGVALQVNQELADEILTPMLRRLGRSMEMVAEQQLTLINQEWDVPRTVKVLGTDSNFDVQMISNLDLKNNTDVHIEVESLFPELRGSKQQRLFDLWDRKIIDDPKVMLRAMRYGSFDEMIEAEEKKYDMIMLDINRIKKGKEPEITQFQDHVGYVKELGKFMQTPEFDRLIPERKQLAAAVLQAHLQALQGQFAGPQGEPAPQQNGNAVQTSMGPTVPSGAAGNAG